MGCGAGSEGGTQHCTQEIQGGPILSPGGAPNLRAGNGHQPANKGSKLYLPNTSLVRYEAVTLPPVAWSSVPRKRGCPPGASFLILTGHTPVPPCTDKRPQISQDFTVAMNPNSETLSADDWKPYIHFCFPGTNIKLKNATIILHCCIRFYFEQE